MNYIWIRRIEDHVSNLVRPPGQIEYRGTGHHMVIFTSRWTRRGHHIIIGPGWAMLLSIVKVVFFGRALCTKETLSDFC